MLQASVGKRSELIIGCFGLIVLLVAEWVMTSAIPGTQYSQGDGKMAQAVIHTAFNFGGIFQFNNINPLQGFGSQLLPHNVWLNPAYWPFALVDSPLALDVSALVALGCLAVACYLMARSFDVPMLPSIVAAQLSIILFGPLAIMLLVYQVFWIDPGTALVYAPQLVALGVLGRLQPGRIRGFIIAVGGIFALLLYSLGCDPLWAMIGGIGLLGAYAVVALGPLRVRPILVRGAALGCCLVLLLASGALGYVYTLTQYSARVWFSDALSYVPQPFLASIVFISPKTMGSYYGICAAGWLLGLLFASGRVRVLIMAGLISFAIVGVYSTIFLLMLKWWLPLPLYVEHSLFPLFTTSAVAGYWATLRETKLQVYLALTKMRGKVASVMRMKQPLATSLFSRPASGIHHAPYLTLVAWLATFVLAVSVPATAMIYVVRASPTAPKFEVPFPNEPELVRYFGEAVGLRMGGEFRGSVAFVLPDDATMYNLWVQGIPTLNEYSQLVTPQVTYFGTALFKYDIVLGQLNSFRPWISDPALYDALFKTFQALGVRYIILYSQFPEADQRHLPVVTIPRRPVGGTPANWIVYEFPNPNLGNYSPTEVATAKSGAEVIATVGAAEFDFTKQVVLSTAIDERLVPAHNMRVSLIRGGLHVSGSSDGTSLVILPQQFSRCLRAGDTRVRLVRANLVMTGMMFSGNIDTDIMFDYGIFSPGCRRIDLAEVKGLIDVHVPTGDRIFVDWNGAVARFRDAGAALGLLTRETPAVPQPTTETPSPPGGAPPGHQTMDNRQTVPYPPPEEPAPSGPAVTQETVLADLPTTTSGFAFIGIQGLNAKIEVGDPVVTGQPILRLVAVPTAGRHYIAAQATALDKNQIYRITAWVKGRAGVRVEMQASDELKSRDGAPANYGNAIFDPAARTILSASGGLKGRGVEQGPDEWQKIWVDIATADGRLVVSLVLVSKEGDSFKGDGRFGLTFGGAEVAVRN